MPTSERLGHIVEQILDLYRSSTDQYNASLTLINLAALVREVLAQEYPRFDEKHQTLEFQGNDCFILGDQFAITTLLLNLLSNANKYTPVRGQINVSVRENEGQVILTVEISEWFDYVGQEIVNASLQVLTTLLIVVCTWAAYKGQRRGPQARQSRTNRFASLFVLCAATAVALAITREGSEILLYLSGFFQQQEYFQTIMVGSSIGFSIGILLYYGLSSLPLGWRLDAAVILMVLFAGNRQRLRWEFGAIFGLDSKSPNRTLRLLLEFEF